MLVPSVPGIELPNDGSPQTARRPTVVFAAQRRSQMTHLGNGLCIAAIEIMLIFAEGSAGLMRVNQKPINCHKCC